jgi:hypothetical protein
MAASDQIVFRFPRDRINERSSLTVIARFRDRGTDADVTPSLVKYRIDNASNGVEILDWTSIAAAAEVSIATTPDQNDCTVRDETQRNRLTVAADFGLASQFNESFEYTIRNLGLEQP